MYRGVAALTQADFGNLLFLLVPPRLSDVNNGLLAFVFEDFLYPHVDVDTSTLQQGVSFCDDIYCSTLQSNSSVLCGQGSCNVNTPKLTAEIAFSLCQKCAKVDARWVHCLCLSDHKHRLFPEQFPVLC